VSVKPTVALRDQRPVEPCRTAARLISGHQQQGLPRRIKGKRHAPHSIVSVEAQLFHVGMLRSIQRVHPRPTKLRTEMLQQLRLGEQFQTDGLTQLLELGFELRRESD
jgi:hypothetical protein